MITVQKHWNGPNLDILTMSGEVIVSLPYKSSMGRTEKAAKKAAESKLGREVTWYVIPKMHYRNLPWTDGR